MLEAEFTEVSRSFYHRCSDGDVCDVEVVADRLRSFAKNLRYGWNLHAKIHHVLD